MALQGSRNGESLLADGMQDGVRVAEDAQRQALEKQAAQTAREMAGEGRATDAQAGKVREIIGDVVRGLDGQKAPDRHITLADDPLSRRQEMAVQQVATEHLQRERLQQTEREMVRDLHREKTFGGD